MKTMNMLKNSLILISIFFLVACGGKESPQRPEPIKQEYRPLIVHDEETGSYTEWYPGHQQIKVTGRKNSKGERIGIWKYYSEQGVELSVAVYTNGKKDGHIVVKHPNGALHYVGEYQDDERIGEWRFYNTEGELIETINYTE